jgi:hypothetical protein
MCVNAKDGLSVSRRSDQNTWQEVHYFIIFIIADHAKTNASKQQNGQTPHALQTHHTSSV